MIALPATPARASAALRFTSAEFETSTAAVQMLVKLLVPRLMAAAIAAAVALPFAPITNSSATAGPGETAVRGVPLMVMMSPAVTFAFVIISVVAEALGLVDTTQRQTSRKTKSVRLTSGGDPPNTGAASRVMSHCPAVVVEVYSTTTGMFETRATRFFITKVLTVAEAEKSLFTRGICPLSHPEGSWWSWIRRRISLLTSCERFSSESRTGFPL